MYGAFPGGIDPGSTRPQAVTIRYFPSCADMELSLRLFSETRLWPNMRELFCHDDSVIDGHGHYCSARQSHSAVVENIPHGETTGEGKCEG
jgi:hypothetical protein